MILDGKELSKKIKTQLKLEVETLKNKTGKTPKLAVVLVGDDPASAIYVKNKKNACKFVGITSEVKALDKSTTQTELESVLSTLNSDKTVNGILLQLPLPNGLNERQALNCIAPQKDVDGLTTVNMGKLLTNEQGLTPCTPTGIMELFNEYNINLDGKHVVIINRSLLVGKPLEQMLLHKNATVTICHSHTKNIESLTKNADIIVTAVGKKNFLTKNMVKKNATIIDVAIVRDENGICGDADFKMLVKKAEFITPVPGGVGPLTIAMLLKNTIKAFKNQNNLTD